MRLSNTEEHAPVVVTMDDELVRRIPGGATVAVQFNDVLHVDIPKMVRMQISRQPRPSHHSSRIDVTAP